MLDVWHDDEYDNDSNDYDGYEDEADEPVAEAAAVAVAQPMTRS